MNFTRIARAIRKASRSGEVLLCRREMKHWLRVTGAYVGVRGIPYPHEIRLRSGLSFVLEEPYDLDTFWQIFFHRVYAVLPEDRFIVDVGANIGLFSCYAASSNRHRRVFALEPFPATFRRLEQSIERNRLESRVSARQAAVSDNTGIAKMTVGNLPSQMARIVDESGDGALHDVPTLSLADCLEASGFASIDLLKIDIEGSEFRVLETAPPECLERVRRISVEYHCPLAEPRGSWQQLVRYLDRAGFKPLQTDRLHPSYDVLHLVRSTS